MEVLELRGMVLVQLALLRVHRENGNSLPNNQRHRRRRYALCHMLHPVLAAHMGIFRMDSNSTSYVRFNTVEYDPFITSQLASLN